MAPEPFLGGAIQQPTLIDRVLRPFLLCCAIQYKRKGNPPRGFFGEPILPLQNKNLIVFKITLVLPFLLRTLLRGKGPSAQDTSTLSVPFHERNITTGINNLATVPPFYELHVPQMADWIS